MNEEKWTNNDNHLDVVQKCNIHFWDWETQNRTGSGNLECRNENAFVALKNNLKNNNNDINIKNNNNDNDIINNNYIKNISITGNTFNITNTSKWIWIGASIAHTTLVREDLDPGSFISHLSDNGLETNSLTFNLWCRVDINNIINIKTGKKRPKTIQQQHKIINKVNNEVW